MLFRSADQDPAQAAAWIERIPAGKSYDAAVSGYADGVAGLDPAGALQWAQTIADRTKRENTIERTFDRWRKSDADAAKAWLAAQTTLSEAFRQRLKTK